MVEQTKSIISFNVASNLMAWMRFRGVIIWLAMRSSKSMMFSMNIPLWRDKYKAAERQSKANVRRSEYEKTEVVNETAAKAVRVLYDVEDSQRKISLYGDILVAKAKELVETSESAYRAGEVDFLSLIDAQRMLLRYKLDHARAITDNQQKIAELEALIGTELQGVGYERY